MSARTRWRRRLQRPRALLELSLLPPEYEVTRRDLSWVGDRRVVYPSLLLLFVGFGIFMASLHIGERIEELQTESRTLDAEIKKNDLNARDLDQACRIIEGTARSMGIEVVEG